jgi:hypothetical protein
LSNKKDPEWEQFEKAVTDFVKALDQTANVQRDIRRPDVHTNRPRQLDVWIEAKVFNLYPIALLISCKLLKRKIN